MWWSAREGGWEAWVFQERRKPQELVHWKESHLHSVYLSLVILPALLLATPARIVVRLRLLAFGLAGLFLLHVVTIVLLGRGYVCLMNSPGAFEVDIHGTAGAGVAGGHDQLVVANNVSVLGDLDLMPSGFTSGDLGSTFVILEKTAAGAISGTFTGLPEGTLFMDTDYSFSITYQGGNGNDIALTFVKFIPEPSTFFLMGLGLLGLLTPSRRRRFARR